VDRCVGHVDAFQSGVIWGWAHDPCAPEDRLRVRVLLDDQLVETLPANEFRPDLLVAGVGDGSGSYAFHFVIPEPLRSQVVYALRFCVDSAQGRLELDGSPLLVSGQYPSQGRVAAGELPPFTERVSILPSSPSEGGDPLLNSGLAILNEPYPDAERTLIVIGHARSGTSLVARGLHVLGLPMGVPPGYSGTNFEDDDFLQILTAECVNTRRLDRLIALRNHHHACWGFKLPAALNHLPYLLRHTRNPQLICVFRDLLAIAVREHLAVGVDFEAAIDSVLSYQQKMLDFLRDTAVPCLLVSYEKALLNAPGFCQHLVHFAGLEADESLIDAAVLQINPNQPDYVEQVGLERARLGLGEVRRGRVEMSAAPQSLLK